MSDNNLSTRDMILQRLKGDSMQELVSLGTDYLVLTSISRECWNSNTLTLHHKVAHLAGIKSSIGAVSC